MTLNDSLVSSSPSAGLSPYPLSQARGSSAFRAQRPGNATRSHHCPGGLPPATLLPSGGSGLRCSTSWSGEPQRLAGLEPAAEGGAHGGCPPAAPRSWGALRFGRRWGAGMALPGPRPSPPSVDPISEAASVPAVQARRIPKASVDSRQRARVTGRAERRFRKNRARTPHVWGPPGAGAGSGRDRGVPVSVRGGRADSLAPVPGRALWPAPTAPRPVCSVGVTLAKCLSLRRPRL